MREYLGTISTCDLPKGWDFDFPKYWDRLPSLIKRKGIMRLETPNLEECDVIYTIGKYEVGVNANAMGEEELHLFK